VGDLVELEREQRRRGDERQVLRPALPQPQPDRLDALDDREQRHEDADPLERPVVDREQPPDLGEDPVLARLRPAEAVLEVGDRAEDRLAQLVLVLEEGEDQDRQRGEDDEVQRAVDRDQPQHDLVAQRAPAERQLELVAAGRERPRRRRRRRQGDPAVAAQAAVPAGPVVARPGEDRVLRAQLRGVGPREQVPAGAARDQLPVQARDVAPGTGGPRRVWLVGHARHPPIPAMDAGR